MTFHVGIPRSPSAFVKAAREIEHPFVEIVLEDVLVQAVFNVLTAGVQGTQARREQVLARWQHLAETGEEDEEYLHTLMHPETRRVLQGKRLHLFASMLEDIGAGFGEDLVEYMFRGFPLVGAMPAFGLFDEEPSPAHAIGVEELARRAADCQKTCAESVGPSGDETLDFEVEQITEEEVAKGWLAGPYCPSALNREYGVWLPARRFGIRQGRKTRVIDDYSLHGQNDAAAASEKVDMSGIDTLAAVSRLVLASAQSRDRTLELELSSGVVLRGRLHDSWVGDAAADLVGRVWDLSSAYRQCARAPEHAQWSIVAVWSPTAGKVHYYTQPVLPFGARGSVYGFCSVSRALWLVMVAGLDLWVGNYVDDYPHVELADLAEHTTGVVERFFNLLGWDLKEAPGFSKVFEPLGVVCNLESSTDGEIVFANKASRVAEIEQVIAKIRHDRFLPRPLAREVRGRFQFSAGQIFARRGARAVKALGKVADGHSRGEHDVNETICALEELAAFLKNGRPHSVLACPPLPALLFTDGACEESAGALVASMGAVLFLPEGGVHYFGCTIGPEVLKLWTRGGSQQVIGQAELLPVVMAKVVWAELLKESFLLTFIDNESAKFALIAGSSPVDASSHLVAASGELDALLGIRQWCCRVPTASNIADAPSRLEFGTLVSMGATAHQLFAHGRRWPTDQRRVSSWKSIADRLGE